MDTLQIDGEYTQYSPFSDSPEDRKAVRTLYRKQFGKDAPEEMPYHVVLQALATGYPDPDSVLDDE